MGNKTPIIRYFEFVPPYCNFTALDAAIISLKEHLQNPDLLDTTEIIINPTKEQIQEAENLMMMNSYILSNV